MDHARRVRDCRSRQYAMFWTFGVFLAVPWRESRMLALNAVELQVLGIPLIGGLLVAWGALHILALADRSRQPRPVPKPVHRAGDRLTAGGVRRHVVEQRAPCLSVAVAARQMGRQRTSSFVQRLLRTKSRRPVSG
jgi:hypothetical protein